MSDEKKLSDDLEDMIGSAKDGAKKAADKAGDFAEEAKEKAKEFASEAKEAANEFAGDAKEILSDGKNVAIIAHMTLIGWIIALVMNSSNKTEYGSFYIRQMLGLLLLGVLSFIPIPFVNFIIYILVVVLWVMSLISAMGGTKKPVFLFGEQFQDWFKSF
ncbi:YtxH domain-containing protein [Oceanihabitans sp.]|jgi:ElaB/YqjD/DUF883 family membrane-anchored ribosome-binding protein|nr:YtxH domain-containing protein [Oceanihabitans sp.]